MTCFSPLEAYYGERGASGKRAVVFSRSASFSAVVLKLPCGQCIGCRLERSRQWAVRCMHERNVSSDCVFVTLTYDDKSLPLGGSLVKRDLQLFMKRLRKAKGSGVRFYACGEYGEISNRPHYHLILFNCWFEDRKELPSRSRFKLHWSRELERLWPFGQNVIGDVTFDSCAYVARYVMKKVTGDRAEAHYGGREPEFTVMSRRPGIGLRWFEKYGGHAYQFDSVVMNGKEVRPPRYYDGKFELVDGKRLGVLKVKRRRAALAHREDLSRPRLRVREKVTEAALRQKGRVL